MTDQYCNYADNETKITITDPKGLIEPITLGYVQEFNVEEEQDVTEEATFDGYCVNTFKYGKTSISMTRIIRFNIEQETKVQNILDCMKTDPMNITAVFKRTSTDYAKNPVGKYSVTYKNCRLASNKKDFKPDEEFKQELEFKSEGILRSTETDEWAWFDGE